MSVESGQSTNRTQVRRAADRGIYDRATIDAILDEALFCHVGFVDNGQPFVIPTLHVRIADRVYIHGSHASRMMQILRTGAPACLTVTLLDGLVLARSAFHHSMNYRSIVVLGCADVVTEERAKLDVLRAIVEQVIPGRWTDSRKPSPPEVAGTELLSFPLTEASAKVRSGPPVDDDDDYALPFWAGVIPLTLQAGEPIPDSNLKPGTSTPRYASEYSRSTVKP